MLTGHREQGAPEKIETEDGLVSMVDEEFDRRRKERRPFEMQWQLNIAFIEGNQFVDVNPAVWALEEIPKLTWYQEREAFNQIAPIVESRLARLSRMRPILRARPGTNEQKDLFAAKVGTGLAQHTYRERRIQRAQARGNAWMESTGTVFDKNIWNPQSGPIIGAVEHGDDVDLGLPVMPDEVRAGDLDVAVASSFELYPDSSYRDDLDDCHSIIHAKAYHVDEVLEYWNVVVTPESLSAIQLEPAEAGSGGLGYGGSGGFRYKTSEMDDHVLVKEYWEKPSRVHPDGQLILVAGGKLLHAGPMPFRVGEEGKLDFPFVRRVCVERPGCFWGRSIVERLIPVQRRYNALRNRKAEYLNRTALGQWTAEDGAVDLEDFEKRAGEPGAVLVYQRGYARPEPVEMKPLPVAFQTEEQALLQEFSMLSGVSEMSRHSEAPAGVKSGVALAIALEQDDTRLTLTANNIEKALVESGKQWLRLYKQFVQDERVLKLVGENNVVEVLAWTGADIRSDDLIVEPVSAALESPAQRRQMVFELLTTGLLNDPETGVIDRETRAKVLEMIELGNWETADHFDQLQIARAERENLVIEEGQMAQAASYDDHVIHINRHTKFRLTVEYEAKVAANPQMGALFDAHVAQHLQYLAPAMGEQPAAPSAAATVDVGMPPADDGQAMVEEEVEAAGQQMQEQRPLTPIVHTPIEHVPPLEQPRV